MDLRIHLLSVALLVLGMTAVGCGPSDTGESDAELSVMWELTEGLDRPESVVYDPRQEVLLISSIVGDATAKDTSGYISRVSMDGELLAEKWVAGLHAPKGIDVGNGRLYVADVNELVVIELKTARIVNRYTAKGSKFLNDVTVGPDGAVYVSDSRTQSVYRLQDGKLTRWLQSDEIKAPNGLLAEQDRLLIAANGTSTENPGGNRYLMAIDYADQSVTNVSDTVGIGALDGIKPDGHGGYYLTDWGAGTLMQFRPNEGVEKLRELGEGAADLEVLPEQGRMYVPVMTLNKLVAFRTP